MNQPCPEFFARGHSETGRGVNRRGLLAVFLGALAVVPTGRGADGSSVPLPSGLEVVWDVSCAYHETTPNRD